MAEELLRMQSITNDKMDSTIHKAVDERYYPEYYTDSHRKYNFTAKDFDDIIENNEVIETKVVSYDDEKEELIIDLGNTAYGVIPKDELELSLIERKSTKPRAATFKTNKHIKVTIKSYEVSAGGRIKAVCSRKELQKECYDNYISKLIPGDVIIARVVNVTDYGIFCDIGCGITALLPIEYISVVNTFNLVENSKNLKKLLVVVKTNDNGKIVLSHKELLGTWKEEASQFEIDQEVVATVINIQDYGIFLRLSQNLSGLADLTDEKFEVGDTVKAKIININENKMKIRLMILSDKAEQITVDLCNFEYKNKTDHIDEWVYSTPESTKHVMTSFAEEE